MYTRQRQEEASTISNKFSMKSSKHFCTDHIRTSIELTTTMEQNPIMLFIIYR